MYILVTEHQIQSFRTLLHVLCYIVLAFLEYKLKRFKAKFHTCFQWYCLSNIFGCEIFIFHKHFRIFIYVYILLICTLSILTTNIQNNSFTVFSIEKYSMINIFNICSSFFVITSFSKWTYPFPLSSLISFIFRKFFSPCAMRSAESVAQYINILAKCLLN